MKFIRLIFILACSFTWFSIQAQEVASDALNASVPLSIHPTGNNQLEPTYIPLVYLGDQKQVNLVASLADYLVQKEGWPQLLVVGIDASAIGSLQEKLTSYTNYKADPFKEFLANELISYLSQQYSMHPFRILAGHQDAGAYVFTTMMDKQDAYHAFICLAPTFYHLPEAELYYRTFLVDHFNWDDFFYVAQGFGDDAPMKESLALTRLMLAHSIERPIDFHFEFFEQVRNSALLSEAFPGALRKLFADLDLAIMHKFGGPEYLWDKKKALIGKYNFDPLNLKLPKIPVARVLKTTGDNNPYVIPSKFNLLWHQQQEKYSFEKKDLINLQNYFQANGLTEASGQVQKILNNEIYGFEKQNPENLNHYKASVDLEEGHMLSVLTENSNPAAELHVEGARLQQSPVISIQFDGADDIATVNTDKFNDLTGSFSVATWINPASVARFEAFISQAYQGSNKTHWRLGFGPMAESQWGLTIWNNAWKDHVINQTIPINTWTHLTVVVDQSLGEIHYFMNGEKAGSVEQVFPLFATNEPVILGRGNNFFHGSLSHIHFYERGLSAAEAKAIFEQEKKKFK